MYRIGAFSTLTQIPIKTLRYYDEVGVLIPARVERATGYRYYEAIQVQRLNRILVYRDLGFSLREIRALLADDVPADQVRGMLRRKREQLERDVLRERARLARASAWLDLLDGSGRLAAHEVAVRDHRSCLVASVRDVLASHDECERLFEELDHEIAAERYPAFQRGAIWHACADGAIDCEVFVVLPARVSLKGRGRLRELPGHQIASLVYRGDEDYPRAYRELRRWLAVSGVEVLGPKREMFLADSDDADAPVTEIQFPIAVASASALPPAASLTS
jgi:DNA-binding transcriptional MerR regulator